MSIQVLYLPSAHVGTLSELLIFLKPVFFQLLVELIIVSALFGCYEDLNVVTHEFYIMPDRWYNWIIPGYSLSFPAFPCWFSVDGCLPRLG